MPGKNQHRSQQESREETGILPRYRFYLANPPVTDTITLRGDLAHRLARVLRLSVGTHIELFDGFGQVWTGILVAVSGSAVEIALSEAAQHIPLEPPVVLLAGLIRPNRFEWLLEKATELGATTIQPVLCERGAVRPAEIGAARLDRWRRITIEAAEQCGRVTVPELGPPLTLMEALVAAPRPLFVAAEPAHGAAPSLVGAAQPGTGAVSILTGPEGGLTPNELVMAVAAGGSPVSLGRLVLRAETAAIAALAVMAMLRPDAGSRPPSGEGEAGMR